MSTLITGAHAVDPRHTLNGVCDILIEDGTIAQVAKRITVHADETVDGAGWHALPGLIDLHTHLREPGFENKETIASGVKAARQGGYVACVSMPNTDPPCDNQSVVEHILRKADENGFTILPCGTMSKGREGKTLSEMADLKRAGCVAVSDDGDFVSDARLARHVFEYASMLGLIAISHAEEPGLSRGGVMNEGLVSTMLGLKGIPHASEVIAVSRDIELARLTGAHLHIAHVSTARAVELVRLAKAEGLCVTCEVTPHHLTLTDRALEGYDPNFKMNPPLRTEADRQALLEGLKDGTVDAIATDHAPHAEEEKDVEFTEAPVGVIGLETALAVVLTDFYQTKKLSLQDLVQKFAIRPAEILGLTQFNALAKGSRANITLVDLGKTWTVTKEGFGSKSKNSCFLGRELTGRVVATVCRGRVYYAAAGATASGRGGEAKRSSPST